MLQSIMRGLAGVYIEEAHMLSLTLERRSNLVWWRCIARTRLSNDNPPSSNALCRFIEPPVEYLKNVPHRPGVSTNTRLRKLQRTAPYSPGMCTRCSG